MHQEKGNAKKVLVIDIQPVPKSHIEGPGLVQNVGQLWVASCDFQTQDGQTIARLPGSLTRIRLFAAYRVGQPEHVNVVLEAVLAQNMDFRQHWAFQKGFTDPLFVSRDKALTAALTGEKGALYLFNGTLKRAQDDNMVDLLLKALPHLARQTELAS